jgi:hypothetical protein
LLGVGGKAKRQSQHAKRDANDFTSHEISPAFFPYSALCPTALCGLSSNNPFRQRRLRNRHAAI